MKIETTKEQNKRFGKIKAGYIVNPKIISKPESGKLLYKGKVIKEDQPFSLLQKYKKELIQSGCKKEDFKLEYFYPNK